MNSYKVICVGVTTAAAISTEAQELLNTDALLVEKVKHEVKFTAPEITKENMAAFEIAPQQEYVGEVLKAKTPIAEKKSSWEVFNLNVVTSRDKPDKMTFSDGTVASVTYGYVNGSTAEEPVAISFKRSNEKSATIVTLADELNYGVNTSGKEHPSMRQIVYDLKLAKDLDLKNYGDYSTRDRLFLQKNTNNRLSKIGTTLKQIRELGRKPMDNFRNNRFAMQVKSKVDTSRLQAKALNM
ncbi:MAG: hypothetical protein IJ532_02300 [Alphaproteobacteria bacterium]|nr:hypothetical protein [Alphaproteobacteria bacterium]